MSLCIPSFRNFSVPTVLLFWRLGGKTIRFSFRLEPKHSAKITPPRRLYFTIPATLLSRLMHPKLALRYPRSFCKGTAKTEACPLAVFPRCSLDWYDSDMGA